MIEPTPEPNSSPTDPTSTSTPPTSSSSKGTVVGLIALLLVAAVGGWAGYIYVTGKDGFSWKRFTFQSGKRPPFVPVTGQLFYNGQPMVSGTVQAVPVDPDSGAKTAFGPLDQDGNFRLLTDIDGRMTPGAFAGEYKFLLNVVGQSVGASAPPELLPKEYYDASTTPLKFTIAEGETNHFVIKEQGEEIRSARTERSKFAGKQGRPSRQEFVTRIMDNDRDGDGRISREEAPERLRPNFERMDANQDGFLDRDELNAGLRSGRGKKGRRNSRSSAKDGRNAPQSPKSR